MSIKDRLVALKKGTSIPDFDETIKLMDEDKITPPHKKPYYKMVAICTYAIRGEISHEKARDNILACVHDINALFSGDNGINGTSKDTTN